MDVEQVGKLLFGRACRLELALWIARRDKPRLSQSEPPKEVILPSYAVKELPQFVRSDMLEEERPDDDRRVWYVRTDNSLWKIVDTAAEVLELD